MFAYRTQTDQRQCYDEGGRVVPCEGTGQDACLTENRRPAVDGRFSVEGHVVRDTLTGAVWSRDANPAQFPLTWHEALGMTADMRQRRMYGYSDWQLPSRDLLYSLISHQYINPAIDTSHPFENIFNGYYWTKDSCCRLPDQAWYVHLGGGRIHRGMKHGSYLVWPICPGTDQTADAERNITDRFAVAGEAVRDNLTGLTWSINADPLGRRLSWQAALTLVQDLNDHLHGGRHPWRMPNIRELESLVVLDAHSPALPAGHPFENVQDAYWSSTTSVYEPRYAWALYTRDGQVGVGFKPGEEFFLWPVRST